MWTNANPSGGFHRHQNHGPRSADGNARALRPHDGGEQRTGAVNPWFSLINATAVELIPKAVFDVCKQANVQQETVEGIAGCINAWKTACAPVIQVKMMAEAYCSRKTVPMTKLAIFFILHSLTKSWPQDFAQPAFRHFLLVITPIAAELPVDVQKSHLRSLESLRKLSVYTKDQVALIARLFTIKRSQEIEHIADQLGNPSLHDSRSIFVFTTPTVAGKVSHNEMLERVEAARQPQNNCSGSGLAKLAASVHCRYSSAPQLEASCASLRNCKTPKAVSRVHTRFCGSRLKSGFDSESTQRPTQWRAAKASRLTWCLRFHCFRGREVCKISTSAALKVCKGTLGMSQVSANSQMSALEGLDSGVEPVFSSVDPCMASVESWRWSFVRSSSCGAAKLRSDESERKCDEAWRHTRGGLRTCRFAEEIAEDVDDITYTHVRN